MSLLSDFHFLRPLWLLALLPLLLAALLLRRRLEGSAWRRTIDPALARWLVETSWQSGGRALVAGVMLAWLLGVLALAGPAWEQRQLPAARSGDALVVILDLTLSMYAEDIRPSRVVRARLKIEDILAKRADGLTGLIAYAGESHVVIPLTDDVRTISNLLPPLEPRIMPVLGNRPERAIVQANQLFKDAGVTRGRILLISDGIEDAGPAAAAADSRFPISVLGIGTSEGAPISLAALNREGYLHSDGQRVITRLEETGLRALSRQAGGRYARFSHDSSDLDRLLGSDGAASGATREREVDHWVDAGPWLVLLLLPLALLAFRRGLLAAPLLAVLVLSPDAAADSWWRDLFSRSDQQAWQALRQGDPEAAVERFDDPDWRATALYRSERFEESARSFPGADARAHYNRGTALARSGRFEQALAALEAALAADPEMDDARHNRDIVKEAIEQDRPESANEEASQRDDPSWQDDDEGSAVSRQGAPDDAQPPARDPDEGEPGDMREGEQTEDPQSLDGREQDPDEKPGDPSEREAEASAKEREQALEQWMRRIPDDPGALLERKFRHEAELRRREGLLDPDQAGRPW